MFITNTRIWSYLSSPAKDRAEVSSNQEADPSGEAIMVCEI